MEVNFYDIEKENETKLKFAVICATYQGKWIYSKHKQRTTWEIPGGHREIDESINKTAERELYEETGAIDFEITPVSDYSVTVNDVTTFGRLYYSEVKELGELPNLEIGEIKLFSDLPENLTYPQIQPYLYEKVSSFIEKLL